MAKNKQSFYETKSKKLLKYNAMDCAGTARIYEKMLAEERWQEPRVQNLHRIHIAMSIMCAEMHTDGIWVHKENRAFMTWFLEKKYHIKERAFLRMVGLPGMRCTSDDMRALIYKRHESKRVHRFSLPDPFDPKMFTDETLEKISVDAASLRLLIAEGDCPEDLKNIILKYWEAESAWKSRTFLVSNKTEHAIGPDGYLRPGWNSCGTDTMRLSCRDPNVMQWDKELLQMLGVPPGETLIGMDKSQLEIRVMEFVSEDKPLWEMIQTGDVYGADVRATLNLDPRTPVKKTSYDKAPPEIRALADAFVGGKNRPDGIEGLEGVRHEFKIGRLAFQYQAGLATSYSQMLEAVPGIEFNTVKALYGNFHRKHDEGLDQYARDELEKVTKIGYSEGRILFGRRYYPRPPPITEACNWPIQRTASEMMNIETLAYRKRLKQEVPLAKMIFQKHDAVATRCPERYANKVARIKKEMFSTEYTINGRTRPFPVEMKIGRTLGDV